MRRAEATETERFSILLPGVFFCTNASGRYEGFPMLFTEYIRRERRITTVYAERKTGIKRQTISYIERGRTVPTRDELIALANLYGVSADMLMKPIDAAVDVEAVAS
jgi:DNA-binding XRE family transcriptional regulator